jgi:hypothetical protein
MNYAHRRLEIRLAVLLAELFRQLKALYKDTWDGIIGNCSIFTFLGTNDLDSNKYLSERLGKTTVRVESRSYNRGQQGGGSDSEQLIARDLLAHNEIPQAIQARGKSKRFGGSCIVLIDDFKPFFLHKFDTKNHPLFDELGCDARYPKYVHNNTKISVEMAGIREARSERCKSQEQGLADFIANMDNSRRDTSQDDMFDSADFAEVDEDDEAMEKIKQEAIKNEIEAESPEPESEAPEPEPFDPFGDFDESQIMYG